MRPLALSPIALCLAGCMSDPSAPLPAGARAEDCGSCHITEHAEWTSSRHADSAGSPVLAAMLPLVEAAWGPFARTRCQGCHAPGHGGDDGIGCTACHAAVGNHAERDGMLAVDDSVPIAGPWDDASPTPAHASRRGDFLSTDGLCGTCHEVTGPGLLEEPTLTEFRASPQAAIGQTCIDCHMPQADAPRPVTADGTRDRQVRSHRFVGFDPPWGAPPDEAADAAERTRALLAAALVLRVEARQGAVDVSVGNEGAGHAVPTGASFLRDLWVDVERAGVVVAERALTIGDDPTNAGAPVALLTQADGMARGSLAPGQTAHALVPVDGPVEVVLRGRALRTGLLDALGLGAHADEVPTHEIARVRAEP